MSKEFTYQDVAEYNTKKDIHVVIHDKVYDCAQFVDEHPYVVPGPAPRRTPRAQRRPQRLLTWSVSQRW